jgi:hypothetical protein
MNISRDDAKKIADLAHLAFDDAALDRMAAEMTKILSYIDQLAEVEVGEGGAAELRPTPLPHHPDLRRVRGHDLRGQLPDPRAPPKALGILTRGAGSQFDPEMVSQFVEMMQRGAVGKQELRGSRCECRGKKRAPLFLFLLVLPSSLGVDLSRELWCIY